MWPHFRITTSCKWTLAFVTTFRHKSSESAWHNFTMWALSCLFLMKNMFNVTTVSPHNLLQMNPCICHYFSMQVFRKRVAQLHYVGPKLRHIFWPPLEARKCSAAQGLHSEVVPRAFWRLASKSCDKCKGSFARGCEAKQWSHWTCSSLGTIFQPMRINSVPDVKCFCSNKNVLCAQSMVWHFVRHPVHINIVKYFLRKGNKNVLASDVHLPWTSNTLCIIACNFLKFMGH